MARAESPERWSFVALRTTRAQAGAAIRSWDIALPAASLAAIAFACFLWPFILPVPAPVGASILDASLPPFSPGHPLGTDLNGNDNLSRLLHGGRASLLIAIAVNGLGFLVGGSLGALSAYRGGALDAIVMRIVDVMIAFPSLVLVIAIAQGLGPGLGNTVLALTFLSVPAFARVARAETLRLRERPFMAAARFSGTRAHRIVLRHIAPNVIPHLAVFALLGMGIVIVIEGALSFLGLGVPAPYPSLGNMIFHGQQALLIDPLLVVLPSAFLFVTVLSFNVLGDALEERWRTR